MPDNSPAVVVTDTAIIYRASSLGTCLRRLLAARMNYSATPPPVALQKAFDTGHQLEPIILKKLVDDFGWKLEPGSQQEVRLNVGTLDDGRNLDVVGHVDALGTEPGANHYIPIDAKSFAQSTMDDFLAKGIVEYPHYDWQQSVYAEGMGTNGFCLPLYNKATGELTVKVYPTHHFSYEDIQSRVFEIETLFANKTAITDVDCPASWGCPYSYLHDAKLIDVIPDELAPLAEAWLLAKKKANTYSTAVDAIKAQIDRLLPDKTNVHGHGIEVAYVKNSRRIDTQKIKELLTEADLPLDDYYTGGDGSHIVIKEAK